MYNQKPETGVCSGLLGGKEVEMIKRRKLEWGKGGGFSTQHNILPGTRTDQQASMKERCGGVIKMARLWLFTEVLHIQPPQRRNQTLRPSSIQNNTNDAATAKVVYSKHMFTVKQL